MYDRAMILGKDIAALRRKLGDSQAKFAARIGVTQPTVSRWESLDVVPEAASQEILVQLLSEAGMPNLSKTGPSLSVEAIQNTTLAVLEEAGLASDRAQHIVRALSVALRENVEGLSPEEARRLRERVARALIRESRDPK